MLNGYIVCLSLHPVQSETTDWRICLDTLLVTPSLHEAHTYRRGSFTIENPFICMLSDLLSVYLSVSVANAIGNNFGRTGR